MTQNSFTFDELLPCSVPQTQTLCRFNWMSMQRRTKERDSWATYKGR